MHLNRKAAGGGKKKTQKTSERLFLEPGLTARGQKNRQYQEQNVTFCAFIQFTLFFLHNAV